MEVKKTDVLVIGSGGAGVTAAVEAANSGANVIIISKEPIGYGDTRISLGVMSTSPDATIGDTEEDFVNERLAEVPTSGGILVTFLPGCGFKGNLSRKTI